MKNKSGQIANRFVFIFILKADKLFMYNHHCHDEYHNLGMQFIHIINDKLKLTK